jgi:hypothetical protein
MNWFGGKSMDHDDQRSRGINVGDIGITLRFSDEQFRHLNDKLDAILNRDFGEQAALKELADRATKIGAHAKSVADSLRDLSK